MSWIITGTQKHNWTPAEIDTALWLDAADASTITESGGAVSQWDDKSGNQNDAAQATAGNRPTYDALNQSVTFNTTLTLSFASQIFAGASSASIVLLAQNINGGNDYWGGFPNGDNYYVFSNGQIYSSFCAPINSRTNTNYGSQLLLPTIIGIDHTGSSHLYYRNGGSIGAPQSIVFQVPATNQQVLGGKGDYIIYEVVATNGQLSMSNRQKIEGYLAHKWGLTANLPAGHPYKTAVPVP